MNDDDIDDDETAEEEVHTDAMVLPEYKDQVRTHANSNNTGNALRSIVPQALQSSEFYIKNSNVKPSAMTAVHILQQNQPNTVSILPIVQAVPLARYI